MFTKQGVFLKQDVFLKEDVFLNQSVLPKQCVCSKQYLCFFSIGFVAAYVNVQVCIFGLSLSS